MGSHIFFETIFAAKKEPFALKRKGIGLIFGNVAFADRVLDQLFVSFCLVDRFLPGRKQRPFYQEKEDNDQA
jgi:hypothetical protein